MKSSTWQYLCTPIHGHWRFKTPNISRERYRCPRLLGAETVKITNLFEYNFENMEKVTKFIFSKRRKMLRSIFKKEGGSSFLNSIDINPNIRPQNLTLNEFCKLEYKLRDLMY